MTDDPLEKVLSRLKGVKKSGDEYSAKCPGPNHRREDKKPSLSVTQRDGRVLIRCHADCSTEEIVRRLRLTMQDLFIDDRDGRDERKVFDYRDGNGKLVYQVYRKSGTKDFRHRRPDGQGGYIYQGAMDGVEHQTYNRPKVQAAIAAGEIIHKVEGEKDADRLTRLGLTATTNSGGTDGWTDNLPEQFRGGKVIIWPDYDRPGYDHVKRVAESLEGVAASVKIVGLPGLELGQDVSDWLNKGNTLEDLQKLWEAPEQDLPALPSDDLPKLRDGVPELDPKLLENVPDEESRTIRDTYAELTITAEALLAENPEMVDSWLVDSLIPASDVFIVFGSSLTGKTRSMMDLCRAILTGGKWMDEPVTKGDILYIALDDRRDPLRKLVKEFGLAESALPQGSGAMWPWQGIYREEFLDALPYAMNALRPTLVVVDTLVKVMPRKEGIENDSIMDKVVEDFRVALDKCALENPPALGFVAHPTRGSNHVRGSTAIEGAIPTRFFVKKTSTYDGTHEIIWTCHRKFDETKTITTLWDPELCGFKIMDTRIGKPKNSRDKTKEFWLRTLEAHPFKSAAEIAKIADRADNATRDALDGLVKDGLAAKRRATEKERAGRKGGPKPMLYYLKGSLGSADPPDLKLV